MARLGLFLLVAVITFGTLMYYTEREHEAKENVGRFDSLPMGCWWAIITMTTVGYDARTHTHSHTQICKNIFAYWMLYINMNLDIYLFTDMATKFLKQYWES